MGEVGALRVGVVVVGLLGEGGGACARAFDVAGVGVVSGGVGGGGGGCVDVVGEVGVGARALEGVG